MLASGLPTGLPIWTTARLPTKHPFSKTMGYPQSDTKMYFLCYPIGYPLGKPLGYNLGYPLATPLAIPWTTPFVTP